MWMLVITFAAVAADVPVVSVNLPDHKPFVAFCAPNVFSNPTPRAPMDHGGPPAEFSFGFTTVGRSGTAFLRPTSHSPSRSTCTCSSERLGPAATW